MREPFGQVQRLHARRYGGEIRIDFLQQRTIHGARKFFRQTQPAVERNLQIPVLRPRFLLGQSACERRYVRRVHARAERHRVRKQILRPLVRGKRPVFGLDDHKRIFLPAGKQRLRQKIYALCRGQKAVFAQGAAPDRL